MAALLALIGLGVVVWWISKGLKIMGEWMERWGDRITDYSETLRDSRKSENEKHTNKDTKELSDKIKNMSGKGDTDEEFHQRVRAEIDQLTGS